MTAQSKDIINVYSRRISLFQDLLKCMARERENLINRDIKGIWSSLEEKQSILDSIEETRDPLNVISERERIIHDYRQEDRHKIMELSMTLAGLKQEIRARVAENISFINETLDFFNEIISVMTKAGDESFNPYGPYGNPRRTQRSMMYQGEV